VRLQNEEEDRGGENPMKKFFNKILCPIDSADNLTSSLDLACDVAEGPDATICLLHVIPAFPVLAPGVSPLTISESEARARLEKLAREHLGCKVKYEIHTKIDGDPAKAILKTADELKVDSVVMATHGRKGLGRLILGSVAERVVRESPRPVLTVRPTAESA
jgi:nucleotide-binding universal stress UspA family protein